MWEDNEWDDFTGTGWHGQGGPSFGSEIKANREINYDRPPQWDGKNPHKYARPYIRLLKAWLARTDTQANTQGIAILDNAKDDLRELICTIDEDELLGDTAGQLIKDLLELSYADYLIPKIPEVIEDNIYDKNTHRKKGESITIYLQRKRKMWDKLKSNAMDYPSKAKGYITLRDAHLNAASWEKMETWCQGDYDPLVIEKNMKLLDKVSLEKGLKVRTT